ncbi:MAG: TonB-dependent receptor, partial [Gemmatimonadota bacterium]|nr:TonB-dependent receptor [Gemmatimonadota bacterium]
TFGANFERFSFFNSFNIFRHGVFFLPYNVFGDFGGTTFSSLEDFFRFTDPLTVGQGGTRPDSLVFDDQGTSDPTDDVWRPVPQAGFSSFVTPSSAPYKGEKISVGQVGLYVQDELALTNRFTITAGVRVDFPMYFTDPVANPFSTSLTALDENGNSETVDQASLPGITPLFSPRVGFNYDVTGDRSTQIRGGTGIFTGRVPMVWVGNVISNPGANPNLWAPFSNEGVPQIPTSDDAILQQSFDLNAMDPDFKWPQVWTTNVAVDHRLPGDVLGTLEFIYGKDLNSIYMRNADLGPAVRTLPAPDGRPYYGGIDFVTFNCFCELNPDGQAGIYVIDNTSEGYNYSITAQLRKAFGFGLNAQISYSFTEAKNNLKSTEIASVLWQNQPVQGDPNNPVLSHSEFGQRHRIVGGATYAKVWSDALRTQIGVVFEVGQGNRFAGAGGNRYSFIYSGDVNGDGYGGNDLIYIPSDQSEIILDDITDPNTGAVIKTAQQQWTELDAFITQDKYLNANRGRIAERHGALNPFYQTIDLRVLQDFAIRAGGTRHAFQLSLDVLNVANFLNSGWGVRKVASPAATSPLTLTQFDAGGAPHFNFTGPSETYVDDPSLLSRWRIQVGLRYLFN